MARFVKSKYVFTIGEKALQNGAPRDLTGCPFLLLPSGYPDRVNEYLRDLWTGNWHASFAVAEQHDARNLRFPSRRIYRPMSSSVRETAHRLANYLHWCDEPRMHHGKGHLNPLAATEKDIDRFGDQMEAGLWSSDQRPLNASTIGQRQLSAIQFLQWASARGYVPQTTFAATVSSFNHGSGGGGRRSTLARRFLVVRRGRPGQIRFPTDIDVKTAIEKVEDVALQIGFRLVFFCGLRASEVCNLTVVDIKSQKTSAGGQQFIRVLGKGRKRRFVEIDDDLFSEIIDYLEFERPIRLSVNRHETALLINDRGGKVIRYKTFWAAFGSYHLDVVSA